MSPAMTRTADVQSRGPASRLLRETARPGLRLLPGGLLPGTQFPYESIDDSRYARHRIVRARPAVRHREDHQRQRAARHRGVLTGLLWIHSRSGARAHAFWGVRICADCTPAGSHAGEPALPQPAANSPSPLPIHLCLHFARTRVAVCGSVRIPLPPSATWASRPACNSLCAAPSSRVVCGRYCTRVTRTRIAACGGVRIRGWRARSSAGPPPANPARQPCRNLSPAITSPRPMPERFCIRLSRTPDAVCGSVRIQDGPHPSRKDTRA